MAASETNHLSGFRPSRRAAAFTLVEVMISVALVLFLIIGVNQVFKMTTDTIGQGQALSLNVRDMRAAQGVVFSDLNAAVMQDLPAFIITSSRVSTFRNPIDRLVDRDGLPLTIDLDSDNAEGEAVTAVPGEIISPATYNYRSHRTDRLAFFARDVYRRQTGNDGTFASATQSNEAYIWYGHLMLPNNSGVHKGPGTETFATNQNNSDGSTFALGRHLILMRDPNDPAFVASGEVHYNRRPALPAAGSGLPVAPNPDLEPLAYGSAPSDSDAATRNFTSRYDLAGISIAQFLFDVTEAATGTAPDPNWYQRLLFTGVPAIITSPLPPARDFRFEADRFFAKPLDSAKAARLAPILLNGCSQFIVEYAGNYVTQNDDPGATDFGDIGPTTPDPEGTIDFIVDNSSGVPVRSIRWYGMPRDVAGPVTAASPSGGPDGIVVPGTADAPSLDVVPLRDVRGTASPFERYVDEELEVIGPAENYLEIATDGTSNMAEDARYTCVWGPDIFLSPIVAQNNPLPRMLRITFALDDPDGRLAEGQTYEFVITLPR